MLATPKNITWLLLLALNLSSFPVLKGGHGDPGQKVFALIIGVADYKDKDINDLQYSVNDALAFYHYLKGKAGGSVDTANIRLLVNEMATVANIYNAKNWLEKTVRKNDLVYIYFAGHGDRESSIFQLGFLLAYDTPHKNYLNNALRIEDFNDMATTLSVRTGAEVIIVTDACHSGTLSGIDKVHQSSLVQEQLLKASKNEVRIASCEPDQLSQENEVWGGGRGLFSFYLLNGLMGVADKDSDSKVSLEELKKYVTVHVEDQVNEFDLEDQTPVIEGTVDKVMSTVVDSVKKEALKILNTDFQLDGKMISRSVSEMNMTRAQKFVIPLKAQDLLTSYDFFEFKKKGKDAFLNQVVSEYAPGESPGGSDFIRLLKTNSYHKDELRQELAAVIHDQVQELINIYLAGDEAKMEERRYYNSHLPGYDEVVPMIEVAMGMLDKSHPLYRILEIKKYYFAGLVARLKTPVAQNPGELLEIGLKNQLKAYELEPKAAYVVNELGVLHSKKNLTAQAIKYYREAIGLSSKWAIPYANLGNAYAKTGEFDLALANALKSQELRPDLELARFSLGTVYQGMGNLLLAEEAFQKSLFQNDRHFYPYEKLGQLYAGMTEYALADSFFYESALRKLNTNFEPGTPNQIIENDADGVVDFFDRQLNIPIDTANIDPKDYPVLFYVGYEYFYQAGEYNEAIRFWQKAIKADPDNPVIFYYMARAYYKLRRYEETEFMLQNAVKFYLDLEAFMDYLEKDEMNNNWSGRYVNDFIRDKHYNRIDNDFILGQVYEDWGHFREAETNYKTIIAKDTIPENRRNAFLAQSSIFERLGQWEAAEAFNQEYGDFDRTFARNELAGLYKRAAQANPADGRWWYSRGMLMRSMIQGFHFQSSGDKVSFLNSDDPVNEAIEAFKNALPLYKDDVVNAELNFMIADLYAKSQDNRRAFPYYEAAVKRQPGQASYRMGAITSGIPLFENKIVYDHLKKLDADSTINYSLRKILARMNLMAGDHKAAIAHLEIINRYDPVELREKKLYPALAASWQNRYPEAVSAFESMLQGKKDDPEILYSIALLHGKNKKFEQAKSYLNKALNAGFNYVFVLVQEPLWMEVFDKKMWKKSIKVRQAPREYEQSHLLQAYY